MIIQITGNVKYKITLDPSTWIFDDRKVELSKIQDKENDYESILFSDDKEWNRQIIEGNTLPPTLKSEKKFKKSSLLNDSFAICLKPFLEYTEPANEDEAIISFHTDDGTFEVNHKERDRLYAHFSSSGKRIYDDGMFDLLYVNGDIKTYRHVTAITYK